MSRILQLLQHALRIAAVSAAAAFGSSAALAQTESGTASGGSGYSAIAAGSNSWGFSRGHGTMEQARRAAIEACFSERREPCLASTAESRTWSYAAGACNTVPYTAGHPYGCAEAEQLLRQKAANEGNYGCRIFVCK